MPTPQLPVIPEQTLAPPTPNVPKASPIPLAAASLLAYDNNATTGQVSSEPPAAVPILLQAQPDQTLNQMSSFGDTTMSFGEGIDLSTLGINELQSMINSTSDLFSQPQQNDGGIDMNMFASLANGQTDAQTTNLLASLGSALNASAQQGRNQLQQLQIDQPSLQQQQQQIQQIQQGLGQSNGMQSLNQSQDSGQINQGVNNGQTATSQDVEALLASLNAGNNANGAGQTGQNVSGSQMNLGSMGAMGNSDMVSDAADSTNPFNFDFGPDNGGDVDLSEFAGLFPDGSAQTTSAPTQQPTQQTSQTQPTQSSRSSQQIQPAQDTQPADQVEQPQLPQQIPQTQPTQTEQISQPPMPAQSMSQPDLIQQQQASQAGQPIGGAFSNAANIGAQSDTQIPNMTGMTADDGMQGMGGDYNLEGINLDDFDFGNAGMPNVEGDEFETMFAEFK